MFSERSFVVYDDAKIFIMVCCLDLMISYRTKEGVFRYFIFDIENLTFVFFEFISISNSSDYEPSILICNFKSSSDSAINTRSSAYNNEKIFMSHRVIPFAPPSSK